MATFFVLYDEFSRTFIRAGKGIGRTYSLSAAKHFTSEWSAKNFANKSQELECLTIKKVIRQ